MSDIIFTGKKDTILGELGYESDKALLLVEAIIKQMFDDACEDKESTKTASLQKVLADPKFEEKYGIQKDSPNYAFAVGFLFSLAIDKLDNVHKEIHGEGAYAILELLLKVKGEGEKAPHKKKTNKK